MYSSSFAKCKTSCAYIGPTPSCHHVSSNLGAVTDPNLPNKMGGGTITSPHSVLHSLQDPQGVKTIYLPKTVLALLKNPQEHKCYPMAGHAKTKLFMANTGATDHMLPNKAAFISYYLAKGHCMQMGNNSFAPIIGQGTTIISLNGKRILIRDCLIIPNLRNPLYSLRAHQRQPGCGFIGMYGQEFHVFFPTSIVKVHTATDCYLHYSPVGQSAGLPDVNYVQPMPCCNALASTTSVMSPPPVTIKPDNNTNPNNVSYASHYSKQPPSPVPPAINLTAAISPRQFTKHLWDMNKADLHNLLCTDPAADTRPTPVDSQKCNAPKPLLSINETSIRELLHQPGLPSPPIRPCDTPNPLDTKSHWMAEELHRITGCRRFCNYKPLMYVTKDGIYIDNGKFPTSIATFTTIPKAP
jgi:hypothetical protein